MAELLILDANLALLLAVGVSGRGNIAKHKRLAGYDAIDFDLLSAIIEKSSAVVFTPNVLTETSNLSRHVSEPLRSEIALVLATLIRNASEEIILSRVASARREYVRLGLTDAVLLELASVNGHLLTVDLDLYLAAVRAELKATNFNHIKAERLDYQ